MAGRIADFARRPPRERAAIYAGAIALLGLLYWQFGLSPVRKGGKDAEAELASAQDQGRKLNKDKRARDELLAQQEKLKEQIEQNQKALPTDAEMPAFFDMLARRFSEAGVLVRRREVRPEVTVDNFIKAPVEVEISGTYYQLMQFFASLRPRSDGGTAPGNAATEKDRIVTVEDLSVFDPRVVNNQLILTAKFQASTFRATPVVPPPPTPGQPAGAPAQPAKPATPPPAGAPVPGQPVTPAAAKQAGAAANAATIDRARVDGEPPVGTVTGSGSGAERLKGGL